MKDLCGICGKPFEKKSTRLLHFMNHVTLHEAVAYFDKRGNWRFEKVGVQGSGSGVQEEKTA